MPQITLSKAQVTQLKDFCVKHEQKTFFIAKDQGAYVGANAKVGDKMESIIFYFRKCDPVKDEDWYDNAHDMFGGDDFGEYLPVDWLNMHERANKLVLTVRDSSISCKQLT